MVLRENMQFLLVWKPFSKHFAWRFLILRNLFAFSLTMLCSAMNSSWPDRRYQMAIVKAIPQNQFQTISLEIRFIKYLPNAYDRCYASISNNFVCVLFLPFCSVSSVRRERERERAKYWLKCLESLQYTTRRTKSSWKLEQRLAFGRCQMVTRIKIVGFHFDSRILVMI